MAYDQLLRLVALHKEIMPNKISQIEADISLYEKYTASYVVYKLMKRLTKEMQLQAEIDGVSR